MLWRVLLELELVDSPACGVLQNASFLIILALMPRVNSRICFSMYDRKASELHLPRSMMVQIGTLSRHAIMAKDARTEWVPTSSLENPKVSMPMKSTAALMSASISLDVMFEKPFNSSWKVNISQSSE